MAHHAHHPNPEECHALQMQGLLQTADVERIPAKLGDQLPDDGLGGSIAATVHHDRLDVVIGVGRILEILESVDREGFYHLGIGNAFLHLFRTGLNAIQSVAEVGANRVGAVDKNFSPNLNRHHFQGGFVRLEGCGEEYDIGVTDGLLWGGDL